MSHSLHAYLFSCSGLSLENGPPSLVVPHSQGPGKGRAACLVPESEVELRVREQDTGALRLLAGDGHVKGTLAQGVLWEGGEGRDEEGGHYRCRYFPITLDLSPLH